MLVTLKNVKKELMDRDVLVDLHFLTLRTSEEADSVYVFETNLETRETKKIIYFKRDLGEYPTLITRGRKHLRFLNRRLHIMIQHRWDDVLVCTDNELTQREDCRVIPTEYHSYSVDTNPESHLYQIHLEQYNEWGFPRVLNQSIDYYVPIIDLPLVDQEKVYDIINSSDEGIVNLYCLLEALEEIGLEHDSHDIIRY